MNDNERNYVSNYSTHLDFVIVNHVTKKAVLAIETDGYNFHKEGTEQYQRDLMKRSCSWKSMVCHYFVLKQQIAVRKIR